MAKYRISMPNDYASEPDHEAMMAALDPAGDMDSDDLAAAWSEELLAAWPGLRFIEATDFGGIYEGDGRRRPRNLAAYFWVTRA